AGAIALLLHRSSRSRAVGRRGAGVPLFPSGRASGSGPGRRLISPRNGNVQNGGDHAWAVSAVSGLELSSARPRRTHRARVFAQLASAQTPIRVRANAEDARTNVDAT